MLWVLLKSLDSSSRQKARGRDQRMGRIEWSISIGVSLLILCTLSLRSTPAQAFTPEQEIVYQSCINSTNPGNTFVPIKTYVQLYMEFGWSYKVDKSTLYCGQDIVEKRHGYTHIKNRHENIDWYPQWAALKAVIPNRGPDNWQDLLDIALTTGVSAKIPSTVDNSGGQCTDILMIGRNPNGASHAIGVRIWENPHPDGSDNWVVSTAFPASTTCTLQPWEVIRRSSSADTVIRVTFDCDDVGCILDAGGGNATVYSQATGAQYIGGPFWPLWKPVRNSLGYPTSQIKCGYVRSGCLMHFAKNASIYGTPETGAHFVKGQIRGRWQSMGWQDSALGYPTTNEKCGFKNGGCNTHFEGGSIYYTSATGAHDVQGAIRSRWIETNWQDGPLGYPTSNHKCGFKSSGCNTHFQGGSIYHAPATGAHDVQGAIRSRWSSGGWQDGPLGYPTSNHKCGFRDGGCNTHFQGGSIYHTAATGARAVSGAIRSYWASLGWQDSWIGYPEGEVKSYSNGTCLIQSFEHAAIYWTAEEGASAVNHDVCWEREQQQQQERERTNR